MKSEDKRTDEMKEMDEITDHFINLIEDNDDRFIFNFGIRGKLWVHDKETNSAYSITIDKLVNEGGKDE